MTIFFPWRMTAGLKVPADSQEVPEGVIVGSVETRFHCEHSSRTRCAEFADDTQMRKQLRPAKNSLRMRSFIVAGLTLRGRTPWAYRTTSTRHRAATYRDL